jgi:purine-binding chemotaxis protein CheW
MREGFRRLLVFTLRGERYALDLREVAEVMEPPSTFPIPHAPSCLAGIINFHGSLVAVLDLARFFAVEPGSEEGKILVLDKSIANLALKVDTVENLIPEESILEERDGSEETTARLLIMADGEIRELAVGTILDKLEAAISIEGGGSCGT